MECAFPELLLYVRVQLKPRRRILPRLSKPRSPTPMRVEVLPCNQSSRFTSWFPFVLAISISLFRCPSTSLLLSDHQFRCHHPPSADGPRSHLRLQRTNRPLPPFAVPRWICHCCFYYYYHRCRWLEEHRSKHSQLGVLPPLLQDLPYSMRVLCFSCPGRPLTLFCLGKHDAILAA